MEHDRAPPSRPQARLPRAVSGRHRRHAGHDARRSGTYHQPQPREFFVICRAQLNHMNYGLYNAFLGMRARQQTLDTQANNIANASTAGFKAERLLYSSAEAEKKGAGNKQSLVGGVTANGGIDFSVGSIQQTGRSLDIAIEGDAFLQVQTPQGTRFTRAGNLTLNKDGQLVTGSGDLVVGERGPITIPNNKGEISIG